MAVLIVPVLAMACVVVASNVLVQFPFEPLGLQDLLTWGAFTYPVAFLVTDLTNRRFGPATARRIVYAGFAIAVLMSAVFATPRIALASGTAFLVAQLIDVGVFDRLRRGAWWLAPLVSSAIASVVDTGLFFSLAFAEQITVFGPGDTFAVAPSSLFGFLDVEAPRWVSWAVGDLIVKMIVAMALLVPFGALMKVIPQRDHSSVFRPS